MPIPPVPPVIPGNGEEIAGSPWLTDPEQPAPTPETPVTP